MQTTTVRRWHNQRLTYLCLGLFALVALAAWGLTAASLPSQAKPGPQEPTAKETPVIEVTGWTQCIFTRKAIIAPVPLHPVVEVLVQPGDRVQKGQILVKLDDDEPQADVRNKQAILANARITLKEARRHLKRCEDALLGGSLAGLHHHAFSSARNLERGVQP